MKKVAIMQPTYLPWSGYFGLMQEVDLFVFFDSVQFSRRSWQQRNQIKTAKGAQWLSLPVQSKGQRNQLIKDVKLDLSADFGKSHKKTIHLNYCKANFYDEFSPKILSLIENETDNLCDLNIEIIQYLKDFLGIDTPIIRSSELNGQGAKADLLASLCQEVGATEYVSPPGSREYLLASDVFEKCSIPIQYFEYTHPEYTQQHEPFLPFMSVIDMIFNCGKKSSSLINNASKIIS